MYKWQTLVGSALGLFFAVLVPIAGFYGERAYKKRDERRETLRRIEVGTVVTLNEAHNVAQQMKMTSANIRQLISNIEISENKTEFRLDSVNFPVVGAIYRDEEVLNFNVRSFYLHNKLLMMNSLIKDMNRKISFFREDFQELMRRNEFISGKETPERQRLSYVENLKSFAAVLEEYTHRQFPIAYNILIQINVYNNFLRKKERQTLIDFEGWRRWPLPKHNFSKSVKDLSSVDEIDKKIAEDVADALEKMRRRGEDIQN